MSVTRVARTVLRVAGQYVSTGARARRNDAFAGVRAYAMFIGHPRSGHTIVGAMLDAHPDAVIGHELGALLYITLGFDRRRLFQLILDDEALPQERRWLSGSYQYRVEGQWQGRHREIAVIGDKQAEGATLRLRARPWLLPRLRRTVGVPIRFIHVIRNPFDNIATMAVRAVHGGRAPGATVGASAQTHERTPDLYTAARRYISLCETVAAVRLAAAPGELLELRHEDFVAAPAERLRALCDGLGLADDDGHLAACAALVHPATHRSREKVEWSGALRGDVARAIDRFPFLYGYTFES